MYAHKLIPITTNVQDDGLGNVDDENDSTYAVRMQHIRRPNPGGVNLWR